MSIYRVHIKIEKEDTPSVIKIWTSSKTIQMYNVREVIYRSIYNKQMCYPEGKHKYLELGNLVEMIVASQEDRDNLKLAWEIINTLYEKE